MKKILFLMICLFSFQNSIQGAVYYTEYGEYSNFTDQVKESNDLTDVKTERRYKYYQEVEVGNYFKKGYNPAGYPNLDDTSYIYDGFTWHEVVPDGLEVLEEKDIYRYATMNPIRYIEITNPYGANNILGFGEITVEADGNRLDYTSDCYACSSNYETTINDGINKQFAFYISNHNTLTIDLNDYYDLADLKVTVYLYDTTKKQKMFTLNFLDAFHTTYLTKTVITDYQNNSFDSIVPTTYIPVKEDLTNPDYTETKESEMPITETLTTRVTKVTRYKCKNVLYRYYYIKREYLDGYYLTKKNYIKDEDMYKDYYAYRVRERIDLDEIKKNYETTIIENKNNTIKTINELENNFKLEKTNLTNQSNLYLSEIKNLKSKLSISNQEKKDLIKQYQRSINTYQNELLKENSEEEIKVSKSSVGATKNIVILLIVLLLLITIKIFRKKRHNM